MAVVLRRGYADQTVKQDKGHFHAWERVCVALGTSPWRVDVAANLGAWSGRRGIHQEEIELFVHALIIFAHDMRPRSSKTKTQADPRSAVKKLQAVARRRRGGGKIRLGTDVGCNPITVACDSR